MIILYWRENGTTLEGKRQSYPERPEGYEVSRSAGEVVALQARGSKAYEGVQFRVWGKNESDGVRC